jgi:hypothetical protein
MVSVPQAIKVVMLEYAKRPVIARLGAADVHHASSLDIAFVNRQ